jgi:GxxExxY protein
MEGAGEKIVYKELSYKIVGILYEVYNELGYGFKEIYYERAIKKCFVEKGIKFKEQIPFKLSFKGEVVGTFYLDFLVDDKIILELKKGNYFSKKNIEQVNEYLKIAGKNLAIIANFTPSGVNYKRIINIK